ncbi:GNAT family N-acetyltransferase [Halobacillus naozhouensis]|uniref:GNAT family N-acetyltransferase n=1 Tax=Halobacillus naozhouensis TaxID=554880 RepID=A0ABY8IZZ8_9BACI|nr:GNAT family N-acetyltransferase [Halobacillus naozhouensis]WFT75827.1 GNAT family N-acetyltransferase [Halobacillus naozhouensis]
MIRNAVQQDAKDLAQLMETLGYPTTSIEMERRLAKILQDDIYHTFVYEEDDRLQGMIGFVFNVAYHTDDPHLRVIAFSVRETCQGQGIGRKLMEQTERWGQQHGANMIVLNSGNRSERSDAHQIYHHLGFGGTATGFYKKIH